MIGGGFQNIFKIPELKKRILFTLGLLIVYRIGVHVPVPGIDSIALSSFFAQAEGTIFGISNMFCARHYALYQRFHYSAASNGCYSPS
jgi:preprotein translocase subunit SecY